MNEHSNLSQHVHSAVQVLGVMHKKQIDNLLIFLLDFLNENFAVFRLYNPRRVPQCGAVATNSYEEPPGGCRN